MTIPNPKPCPNCKTADHLNVYSYEQSGQHHVECDKCWYMGPGESSDLKAVKAHNAKVLGGGLVGKKEATP